MFLYPPMRKAIILCLVFSFLALEENPSMSKELGLLTNSFAANGAIKKLQRGIVNVVTAPVEVPKQIRAYWIAGSEKTFHISAWVFCGFVKGVWMTPLRMGSGLWDVITCPLDLPGNGGSLVQPEYVFDDWPKRKKGVVYKNLWPNF